MIKTITALKAIFVTGTKPTQQNFADIFDSFRHKSETIKSDDVLIGENTLTDTINLLQTKTKVYTINDSELITIEEGIGIIHYIPKGKCIMDFGEEILAGLIIEDNKQDEESDLSQIVCIASQEIWFEFPEDMTWYDEFVPRDVDGRLELTIQNKVVRQ